MILGLITARGGSIRLPRKNILPFVGHPLVAWSIMQSRCSRLIDLTVLTTDDEEIAEVGRRYGAKVVMRPVMDDDITAGVPFKMAVDELEKEGYIIDEIISCLPTSPLKKVNDLDDLITNFHMINYYDPTITDMGTYSPDRECFIYDNVEDMTTVYGKPYHVKIKIADKFWKHSKMCGGWGIAKRDWIMKTWATNPEKDSVIDKMLQPENPPTILAYSVEPWQCFETDYECYFKICEVLMEEFILKGQGMNAYTRYAREFRKIVTWEEENNGQLDLSKYIGNSNQLEEAR
jgi:hypothetical protein